MSYMSELAALADEGGMSGSHLEDIIAEACRIAADPIDADAEMHDWADAVLALTGGRP